MAQRGLFVTYASMQASDLITWVLIATAAGVLSRKVVPTPTILGLFGDMLIGVIGAFGVGWLLQQAEIDLSRHVQAVITGMDQPTAVWIDVAIVSFVGALLIRLVLKPFSELSAS